MSRSAESQSCGVGMRCCVEAGKSCQSRNEPLCRSEKEQPGMNFQACSG
ncbi:MAG: hypothetical protein HFG92_15215 [Dorea sp.]|nr:hypothetical protein [Dorea sp.]